MVFGHCISYLWIISSLGFYYTYSSDRSVAPWQQFCQFALSAIAGGRLLERMDKRQQGIVQSLDLDRRLLVIYTYVYDSGAAVAVNNITQKVFITLTHTPQI